MKKKNIAFMALMPILAASFYGLSNIEADASNYELKERMRGRLLLQVEKNGEAWYVHPEELRRYYLGRPADAFGIMKDKAVGISNRDFDRLRERGTADLSGRIILKAEDKGQAYYVNPVDLKLHYLGRPDDAFKIMRELSTGIKNSDIGKIESAPVKIIPPAAASEPKQEAVSEPKPAISAEKSETDAMAAKIFDMINNYRTSRGMQAFVLNEKISSVCESFSRDMAAGRASFSHDGFDERAKAIKSQMDVFGVAENIAWNSRYQDPASQAVEQWLNSAGHKKNIDGNYKYTGIGVAKSGDGKYYFTQIFVR
jgi:uncharacterized protein YkwD